jgi:hypothetical protein
MAVISRATDRPAPRPPGFMVTEIAVALEPVSRDPFIDSLPGLSPPGPPRAGAGSA